MTDAQPPQWAMEAAKKIVPCGPVLLSKERLAAARIIAEAERDAMQADKRELVEGLEECCEQLKAGAEMLDRSGWGPDAQECRDCESTARVLLANLKCVVCELEETIVDKLPKTADGSPVWMGKRVWVRRLNGEIDELIVGCMHFIGGIVVVNLFRGDGTCSLRMIRPYMRCYSTREAAEAAKD